MPLLREGSLCDGEVCEVKESSVGPVIYPNDSKKFSDQRAVEDGTGKCQCRGSCSTSKSWKNSRYRERISLGKQRTSTRKTKETLLLESTPFTPVIASRLSINTELQYDRDLCSMVSFLALPLRNAHILIPRVLSSKHRQPCMCPSPSQTVLLWADGPGHKQQIDKATNVWCTSTYTRYTEPTSQIAGDCR